MRRNIAVFTIVLVGAFPVHAFSAYKLPDTGQQLCYQSTAPYNPIACATAGQDGGQDGAYDINHLSFTDNGNGTVTDNNTGLMWQQNYQSNYNWYQAAGIYHEVYNSSSLNACSLVNNGAHNDWRLPTLKELMSILDLSGSNPGFTIASSFTTANDSRYWAKTDNIRAQSVDFIYGLYFATEDPIPVDSYYVRCVRDTEIGPPARQKLVNALEGTVTDTSTGLMWPKASQGLMGLGAALAYCQALDLGGRQDWRLPNIKELESWLDVARVLNTDFFSGASTGDYWTSTTNYGFPDSALGINVGLGTMSIYLKANESGSLSHYVQCVRSIPAASDGDLNGDGQVTVIDVLLALRAVVGLDAPTQFYLDHADIGPITNGVPYKDTHITVADALLILRKAVGLVSWQY